jgi:hypothetical protein
MAIKGSSQIQTPAKTNPQFIRLFNEAKEAPHLKKGFTKNW